MEKKYLVLVIVVLAAAFGVYAFKYPPSAVKQENNAEQLTLLKTHAKVAGPSKLRMSLIEEMVQNYRHTQLLSIENATKNSVKDDSHSILFDLDTLKKFIMDIEICPHCGAQFQKGSGMCPKCSTPSKG